MTRLLHLASFKGNVGDEVSHSGLKILLSKCGLKYSSDKQEIRDYYQNASLSKKRFDDSFIENCNSYDLVIVGGGGYMEPSVPASRTGTTFDIDQNIFAHLNAAMIFSSIGCFPAKQVNDVGEKKFSSFLEALNSNNKIEVLFRNDGSFMYARRLCENFEFNFKEVLDSGFFFEHSQTTTAKLSAKDYIIINVGFDQLERIISYEGIAWSDFYESFSEQILKLAISEDLDIVFVPHTPQDLKFISAIVSILPDDFLRYRVHVAQYSSGKDNLERVAGLYHGASMIVCGRLHSHVLAIALGKKFCSFLPMPRVANLTAGFLANATIADVSELSALSTKASACLNAQDDLIQLNREHLELKRSDTINKYIDYFSAQGLI